jgi:hypothetical protein
MNVVDSSGWLEYLAEEPNADFFAPAFALKVQFSDRPGSDQVVVVEGDRRIFPLCGWFCGV